MKVFINVEDKKEVLELKDIVNGVFETDVNIKSRDRNVVDARRIYSKILRGIGYTFYDIGATLNKDHATIVHYLKNLNELMVVDKPLMGKYLKCVELFGKDIEPVVIDPDLTSVSLKLLNESLRNQLESLTLENANLRAHMDKYVRLKNIIDILNDETPRGGELSMEIKIQQMITRFRNH